MWWTTWSSSASETVILTTGRGGWLAWYAKGVVGKHGRQGWAASLACLGVVGKQGRQRWLASMACQGW